MTIRVHKDYLAGHLGMSCPTLMRHVKRGHLPAPEYLAGRASWVKPLADEAIEQFRSRHQWRPTPPRTSGDLRREAALRGLKLVHRRGEGWRAWSEKIGNYIIDEAMPARELLKRLRGEVAE